MPKKPKINPRKMMERAIQVMRESIGEARDDGKPNPLVGAVLLRPDGTTENACRGELREGNHAEFTLLERKCVGEKLEDRESGNTEKVVEEQVRGSLADINPRCLQFPPTHRQTQSPRFHDLRLHGPRSQTTTRCPCQ